MLLGAAFACLGSAVAVVSFTNPFYSAGALIGLMFVVVTLTAGRERDQTEHGKHLYTSPIVWHLAVVLPLVLWLRKQPRFGLRGVHAVSIAIVAAGAIWFVQRAFFS